MEGVDLGEVDLGVDLEEDLEVDPGEVDLVGVDLEEQLFLEDQEHHFIVDPVLDLDLEEDKLLTPMDLDLVSKYLLHT